ncbi:MAG: T9SS type A sorting domain-containing protein [Bacteroidales bacterium]|nr:T9SS type A sorting domain-containing protein [Bacteroidales bacterium]
MVLLRNLFIFISLSVSVLAYSQAGTFTKMFTSNSYDEGIAAFRMPNKTYRIIANTGAWGWGSNNIWYIALDSNANFVRHKTMGYGGIDNARAATIDAKGNTFIIGSSTSEVGNSYQMLFLALDSSGTRHVKKYYGGSDWDFGNGITLINDTTLIIVGETYSNVSTNSDAWIMKINIQGDVLWSKTVGGDNKEAFYAAEQAPNGDIICVGHSQSYGNGSYDPFVYRCSTDGDSISQIIVNDSTDGCFLDVEIAADSTFYAGGYQRDTTDLFQDYLLRRYTKDNQMIWYENTLTQKMEARFNTLAFHGKNILAFGKTQKYGSDGDNIFCDLVNRYDGTWLEGFATGSLGDEYAYSVSTDTSNGQNHYLVIGTSTSYSMIHTGVYFMRIDNNLNFDTTMFVDTPSEIEAVRPIAKDIEIRLNPSTDKVLIKNTSQLAYKNMNIQIYDMLGKCIYNEHWSNPLEEVLVDINNWPKSSYSVVVRSKDFVFSKIIVK